MCEWSSRILTLLLPSKYCPQAGQGHSFSKVVTTSKWFNMDLVLLSRTSSEFRATRSSRTVNFGSTSSWWRDWMAREFNNPAGQRVTSSHCFFILGFYGTVSVSRPVGIYMYVIHGILFVLAQILYCWNRSEGNGKMRSRNQNPYVFAAFTAHQLFRLPNSPLIARRISRFPCGLLHYPVAQFVVSFLYSSTHGALPNQAWPAS